MHLTVFQWAGIAAFVAIALLASLRIRSVWSGDAGTDIPVRWARGLPTFLVVSWAMVLGVPLAIVTVSQKHGAENPLLGLLLFLLLAFIFVGTLIGVAASLTGHPEGVVPPHLRKSHGGQGAASPRVRRERRSPITFVVQDLPRF